jgi:protease I
VTEMPLAGARIALLVGPLYEDIEVHYPKIRLEEDGAEVVVADFDASAYRGAFWSLALAGRGRAAVPGYPGRVYLGIHGMPISADLRIDELDVTSVDAVVIPGGYAADHLRRSEAILEFCQKAATRAKPVAAICHGPWVLCSAGLVRGRNITGHSVIRPDVEGAGGCWVDAPCVEDGPIITSRFPNDLGVFCQTISASVARLKATQTKEPPLA